MDTSVEKTFCEIIIRKGILSREEFEKIASEYKSTCNPHEITFSQYLVKQRIITSQDFLKLTQEARTISSQQSKKSPSSSSIEKLLSTRKLKERFAHYEILEEIGRGGMGIIYKAFDTKLKRIVALKILKEEFASKKQIIRFLNEAEASAKLKHPNIIAIYEVGEVSGVNYYTMEFVEGNSLEEILRVRKKLPEKRTLTILEKVARAVNYAHLNNVIHRDLKPGNILLTKDDEPKIMDFGLAKILEAGTKLTMTGEIIGTPFYLAPEQITDVKNVDARSDVYSLGVIMYQALTGTLPFKGKSQAELYYKILNTEPRRLRSLNPAVSFEAELICQKAMQKEKKDRYNSAKDLADDLKHALLKEPISAKSSGIIKKTFHKVKKNKTILGFLCLIPFIIVVLIYLLSKEKEIEEEEITAKEELTKKESELYAKAIEYLNRQKDVFKNYQEALYKVGKNATGVKEIKKSISDTVQYVLNMRPDLPEAYAWSGFILSIEGDEENALTKYNEGLSKNQNSTILRIFKALLFAKRYFTLMASGPKIKITDRGVFTKLPRDTKETKTLRKHLEEELQIIMQHLKEIENEKELVSFIQGIKLLSEQKFDEAVNYLKNSIGGLFCDVEVKNYIGMCYLYSGKYEEARKNFEDWKDVASNFPQYIRYYAGAHMCLGIENARKNDDFETHFNESISVYKYVLEKFPELNEVRNNIGIVLLFSGFFKEKNGNDPSTDFLESIKILEEALKINPNAPDYYNSLANSYHFLGNYKKSQKQDPTQFYLSAVENFNKVLKLDPNNYFPNVNIAIVYMKIAKEKLSKRSDPSSEFELSKKYFKESLNFWTEDELLEEVILKATETIFDYAEYKSQKGLSPKYEYEEVVEYCKNALSKKNDSIQANLGLANAYFYLGNEKSKKKSDPTWQYEESIRCAREVLKIDANNSTAKSIIANASFELGDYKFNNQSNPVENFQEAINVCKELLRENSTDDLLLANIATSYDKIGRYRLFVLGEDPSKEYSEALKYFSDALKKNPSRIEIFSNIALIHSSLTEYKIKHNQDPTINFESAIKNFKECLKLKDVAGINYNVSLTYYQYGQFKVSKNENAKQYLEEALKFAKEAIKLDSSFADAHLISGMIYRDIEDYKSAKESFEEVIQLEPSRKNALEKLIQECEEKLKSKIEK